MPRRLVAQSGILKREVLKRSPHEESVRDHTVSGLQRTSTQGLASW